MPVKVDRSVPRPSFGLPELLVAIHASRKSLQQGWKSANICLSLGVRGIPVKVASWKRPLLWRIESRVRRVWRSLVEHQFRSWPQVISRRPAELGGAGRKLEKRTAVRFSLLVVARQPGATTRQVLSGRRRGRRRTGERAACHGISIMNERKKRSGNEEAYWN
jgi:hypothetical protein